jgi:hypothetical protein
MSIGRFSTARLVGCMHVVMVWRIGALGMKAIGGSNPRISYPRIKRNGTGDA